MNPKMSIIAGIAVFAALLFAGSQGARAAECQSFDAVVADGASMGLMPLVIPQDRLPAAVKQVEGITGKTLGDVSRGFMVLFGLADAKEPSIATFGFESGGCMLEPQTVPYVALLKKAGLGV